MAILDDNVYLVRYKVDCGPVALILFTRDLNLGILSNVFFLVVKINLELDKILTK